MTFRGDVPADAPLFVALDRATAGVRLTGRSVARVMDGLGTAAGLGHVRPHGLRHAAITHALDVTTATCAGWPPSPATRSLKPWPCTTTRGGITPAM